MDRSTITSVSIRNFKSIASADVSLSRLTIFVGQNGAGKSTVLQAVRFLADAVGSESLQIALGRAQELFSIVPVTAKVAGQKWPDVSVGVEINLARGDRGIYHLTVGSDDQSSPIIRREMASVTGSNGRRHHFERLSGSIVSKSDGLAHMRAPSELDRLALPVAITMDRDMKRLAEALNGFSVYDYGLDKLSASQPIPEGPRRALAEDCSNLPETLWHLKNQDPKRFNRINTYLSRMLGGVTAEIHQSPGGGIVLLFPTRFADGHGQFPVLPYMTSDGTLRMAAALAALFQSSTRNGALAALGIEEPEAAVHPAVLPVLVEAMIEASEFRQLLVTTHSPDLIDDEGLSPDNVRLVERTDGITTIRPIDDISKDAVRDRLYTMGELLRLNQLSGARIGKRM